MDSFWNKLPRPFFVLAPMEDVTDIAFRSLIASFAAKDIPRVIYTEFTSADGLVLANESGREKILKKLEYTEQERPIVAQLFTSSPERMEAAARLCKERGFDGVDINMGCPDRAVEKQGSGAALIKNAPLARELIRAAKRGFGGPVSVKTRLGYNADVLEEWLPELLAEEPVAVAIHARTRKEMSLVPARWERIQRAVEIRDELKSPALIIGNGDVQDLDDARARCAETGADGAMLGRAVFGNPWIFSHSQECKNENHSPAERIDALIRHIELFKTNLSGISHDATMKKHFKAYISDWDGAKDLRVRLMEAETLTDAQNLLVQAREQLG